ncbi:hypothetical protein [Clostridium sp. UBA1353]|uniref:hypothetical protein n=1 Tax=Clostridium sp. UBA1353 TaxID=1946347 RepID=UPI0032163B49
MSPSILIPSIDSVTIIPNPVNANTSFLIAISVSEYEKVLESSTPLCGTMKVGEEIII